MVPVIGHLRTDELVSAFATLSLATGLHVWRGGVIALRLGEMEVIVRRWRGR